MKRRAFFIIVVAALVVACLAPPARAQNGCKLSYDVIAADLAGRRRGRS